MISNQGRGAAQVSEFAAQKDSLSGTITLASWNAQKFHNPQARQDLQILIEQQKPDILFVQESRADLVWTHHMGGHFAKAWSYPWPGGISTGVLTLSRVAPERVEPMPSKHGEILWLAPKVFLVTQYALPDREILLAINVHLVSFERWRLLSFRSQLDDLKAITENHQGPVVMAGDFNTWSQKRLRLVQTLAQQLGLKELTDFPSGRTTADMRLSGLNRLLGIEKDFPLDRIYQRGFTSYSAQVLPFASSDHKPILVTLARQTS